MGKVLISDNDFHLITGKTIAVIFDGFINGLGLVRSLKTNKNIFTLIVCRKGAALSYSKNVDAIIYFKEKNEIKSILDKINNYVKLAIPYYCNDSFVNLVIENKSQLPNFSIYPFDLNLLNKDSQLILCEKANINFPKTYIIKSTDEYENLILKNRTYIIKPISSKKSNPFKTKITRDLDALRKFCLDCLESGTEAMISEYIHGDDSHLLTLGGYAHKGELLTPFTGRKISQRPKNNGVASLAENIDDKNLIEIGSRFLRTANFTGIFQIEFKIDNDNNYYFIEFNPRNWSWGYVATIAGSNLALEKYRTESALQIKNESIKRPNFYFWFEGVLYNIVLDKWIGVIAKFFSLLFSKKVTFAIFSFQDPKPFIGYLKNVIFFALRIRKTFR